MLGGRQRAVLWLCFVLGAVLVHLFERHGLASEPLAARTEASAADASFEAWTVRDRAPLPRPVVATAERYGLDPALVWAVILTESGANAQAVSPKGAVGLMQVMPETATWLGFPETADPAGNLDAGCHYLATLLDHFGGDVELALAAYNAGPGAVRSWGTIPPYRETRNYIARVALRYSELTGSGLEGAGTAQP